MRPTRASAIAKNERGTARQTLIFRVNKGRALVRLLSVSGRTARNLIDEHPGTNAQ
jgi:hypothetical protein